MKEKEIEALETYFKTENEYWNGYAFEVLCEVLKLGNFENPETALSLFSDAIDIFTEHFETPLKAVQLFKSQTDKHKLNNDQKLFIFDWVLKYVKYSEFDVDIKEIKNLLTSQTEKLKNEVQNQKPEYNKPLVGDIRVTLKGLMKKELEQLPKTLKELEPAQRLNVLCKLMPYVMPKTESVRHNLGEPDELKIKKWHD